MSAPVLAFRAGKRKPDALDKAIARLRRSAPVMVPMLDQVIDSITDLYLQRTVGATSQKRGNIGKPVITLDRDDREGA